jgi:hypothetical protein
MFSLCLFIFVLALIVYLVGAFAHVIPGELMTLCLVLIIVSLVGMIWLGFTGHAYFGRW